MATNSTTGDRISIDPKTVIHTVLICINAAMKIKHDLAGALIDLLMVVSPLLPDRRR